jgi:hypothetical protein
MILIGVQQHRRPSELERAISIARRRRHPDTDELGRNDRPFAQKPAEPGPDRHGHEQSGHDD